ncbi:type II secretion system protein [Edaphobacter bradus]|uniref:type II secretion system protein n=1 Tax=Edaphobacter bradus TaxID=2259016 RepID=UPI0021E077A3|nr:type II secretion system protein [Edaphobacter bradus]
MEQTRTTTRDGEQGFMLLAMIVAIFLVLLVLSVAAPKVAQNLRREREVEAIHRGNQYVQAIRRFYIKNGNHYPTSMEQLEKSNNIRFLRQKYVDPMTGKVDWRLIHYGEQKTTVKGFFGQPLAGLPGSTGGLGSAAANSSGIGANSPTGSTSAYGSSTSPGGGGIGGGVSIGTTLGGASGSTGGGSTGGISSFSGTSGSSGSSDSSSSTGGITSQSASTFTGGGAPFVGVGIPKDGDSITVLNEQTSYRKWEFLYDPLIEQMGAKAALLGGAPANSSSGFGSSSGGFGTGSGGFGTGSGGFGTGSSGFGNTPGTSGSGTGSSPTGTTPPSGSTTPQQ